ncbi:MAG: hypothetical protein ACI4AK_01580 [Lepagella sp.]
MKKKHHFKCIKINTFMRTNNDKIVKNIYSAVYGVTGVDYKMLASESRSWYISEARLLCILFLYKIGLTDENIGYLLNRGRANICKCRHTAEDLHDVSKSFRDKYEEIENLLKIKSHENENSI